MMNIYLMRHASAGIQRPNPLLDMKRPLDKQGKQHCLHLAHVLNAMKIQFDLIVSSPLKRCMQTASLVGTETGYEAKILASTALAPDASFATFQALVQECNTHENVLFVGHNPTLTTFLGTLLAPGERPARVRLRKGSLARLNLARGPATLQWMLDPRTVNALYATSTTKSRPNISRK